MKRISIFVTMAFACVLGHAQSFTGNFFTTGHAANKAGTQVTELSHFFNASYSKDKELTDLMLAFSEGNGEVTSLASKPIFFGVNFRYAPTAFKLSDKLQGGFTLGYGVLTQVEEFYGFRATDELDVETLEARQFILRDYLMLGTHWDYVGVSLTRWNLGFQGGALYNINMNATASLTAKYSSSNGNEDIHIDNEEVSVARRSFLQAQTGVFSEYLVSPHFSLRGEMALNAMLFNDGVYSSKEVFSPWVGLSIVFK